MPTYHFVAKVPLTAHTDIDADTFEEAYKIAEDRDLVYAPELGQAIWLMQDKWVIRDVDEGPEDIKLDPHDPITP